MLELIKLKLKKPERYCPQILCEIGSSFINSYPSETKLTSEPHCIELGKYVLKKVLGQSTEISAETLNDIATLKRWDATPTHQHKFFQPVNQHNQDYMGLLDGRFNSMLQDLDRQTNILSLVNNVFIKYSSAEEYKQISDTLEKNDNETAYHFVLDKLNELNVKLFHQTLSDKQERTIAAREKNKYMLLKNCNLLDIPFDDFLEVDITLVTKEDNEKFIELLIEHVLSQLESNDALVNSECDELQDDVYSISVSVEDYQDSFFSGTLKQSSTACKELICTCLNEIPNRITNLRKKITLLEQFEIELLSPADQNNFNLRCQINEFKSKLNKHTDRIEELRSNLTELDRRLLDTEQGAECSIKIAHYQTLTKHYNDTKELYLTIEKLADHYVKTLDKEIKVFRENIYGWVELFYKYQDGAKLLAPEGIFHMQRKTINRMQLSGKKIVNEVEMFHENFNRIKVLLEQYSEKSNKLVGLCQTILDKNNEDLMSRLFYAQCRRLFKRSNSQFRVFLSPQANIALDKLKMDAENILDKLNILKSLKTASETITPPRPLKPISHKRAGNEDFIQSPHRKTLKKEIAEAAIIDTDKENDLPSINNLRRGLFT